MSRLPAAWETVEYDLLEDIPHGHAIRQFIILIESALVGLYAIINAHLPILAKYALTFRFAKLFYKDSIIILPYHPRDHHSLLKSGLRRYAVKLARKRCRIYTIAVPLMVLYTAVLFALPSVRAHNKGALPVFLVLGISFLILRMLARSCTKCLLILCVLFAAVSTIIAFVSAPEPIGRIGSVLMRGSGWPYFIWTLAFEAMILLTVPIFLSVLIEQVYKYRLLRTDPDLIIINELTSALHHLENRRVVGLADRAHVIRHLEHAAVCMEVGIPRTLAVPQKSVFKEVAKRCAGVAAKIRGLQIGAALSGNSQDANTRFEIASIIGIMSSGRFDKLPIANVAPRTRLGFIHNVGRTLKSCLVASIPGGVIIVLRYMDVKLSSEVYNWAVAVAIIWAAITLISILDPLYTTRLRAIAEAISIIRGRAE